MEPYNQTYDKLNIYVYMMIMYAFERKREENK